jgi:hypothetical protein
MPWGGGSYTKGNSATGGWTGDASLGIGIEAGRHDTQDNDFATGINQCLNKDGSNAATGNLNLGGFIPTNLAAGTAAAPAICAGNDINTGFFSPAADEIGIATNGTEKIRIKSDGKVGIGTTTPSFNLDVTANSNAVNAIKMLNTSNGSSAYTQVIIGNDASPNACAISLNSSTNTALAGVNSLAIIQGLAAPVTFATSGVERMRINSSGNVAIGTTTTGTARFFVRSVDTTASSYAQWWENSAGTTLGYVRSDGLFNTGSAAQSPNNATTATAANVVVDANGSLLRSTSSARYKTDIQPYTHGLAEVLVLAPKFYKGINDGNKQFAGLIAEDVDDAGLTEFVVYNDSGEPDALAYSNMVALAFKAIQELNAKVEALETRVAQLEGA